VPAQILSVERARRSPLGCDFAGRFPARPDTDERCDLRRRLCSDQHRAQRGDRVPPVAGDLAIPILGPDDAEFTVATQSGYRSILILASLPAVLADVQARLVAAPTASASLCRFAAPSRRVRSSGPG
jgi:hypothetical protein